MATRGSSATLAYDLTLPTIRTKTTLSYDWSAVPDYLRQRLPSHSPFAAVIWRLLAHLAELVTG